MTPPTASLRRLWLGLRTLLGGAPGGFFIPYRHARAVTATHYPALEPLFSSSLPVMTRILEQIEGFADRLLGFDGPPPMPRWRQSWFSGLDGAALYAIVRAGRPRRIIEVGSGHSTRFMAQAISDGGLSCSITCIDPQPRADLGSLELDLQRRLLEPADADLAAAMAPGDILFVDSSHVAMPGSDVDLLLNAVLPRLRAGVLVHLHDIFLPDAYPATWAWRGYNEQIAVACLLQGGGWAIRFASHYLASRHPELLARSVVRRLALPEGALEASLWLEKVDLAGLPSDMAAAHPP